MIQILAALLPAILLMAFIYWRDPNKEPFEWVAKAFGLGLVSSFIAVAIAFPFTLFVDGIQDSSPMLKGVCKAFLCAAIPEEFAKFLMLRRIVKKNPYFDQFMDGIVYAVAVGLGFAALENVLYVAGAQGNEWFGIALSRGIFAVPGHYADAVLMGYFYSLYHFNKQRYSKIKSLILIAPILAHGIYDALLMMTGEDKPLVSFILIGTFLYFVYRLHKFCYRRILLMTQKDIDRENIKKFTSKMEGKENVLS